MKTAKELFESFDFYVEDKRVLKAMMDEYPEYCPITGMERCDLYCFEEGVVYLTEPAYNAYTLPKYDSEWLEFRSIKIDMDDDYIRKDIIIAELWQLLDRYDFEEIKEFYEIPQDDIDKVKEQLEDYVKEEERWY